jgi:WD40 repeat protein
MDDANDAGAPSRRQVLGWLAGALLAPRPAAAAPPASPWCVAFSPDDTLLAVGSEDGGLRLWSTASHLPVRALPGHHDAVFGVCFSPDDRLLASCGRDEPRLRLWDVRTGALVRGIAAHPGWVWAARFSPDGRRIATCGQDAFVRVFDPATGERVLELAGHRGTVKRVSWTADGARLLSIGDDGLLHVWDGATGASLHVLEGHTSWLESVAAGPGSLAVTAGADRRLCAWDVSAGKLLRTFTPPVPDLTSVAVAPSGELAVSGAADGSLRLWSVAAGTQLLRRDFKGSVLDVAFSPNSLRLASAHRDDGVRLWRTRELAELARLGAAPAVVPPAGGARPPGGE